MLPQRQHKDNFFSNSVENNLIHPSILHSEVEFTTMIGAFYEGCEEDLQSARVYVSNICILRHTSHPTATVDSRLKASAMRRRVTITADSHTHTPLVP